MFTRHYTAVRILFARCAEKRARLGDSFGALRRLALEWAYMRDRFVLLQRDSSREFGLTLATIERYRIALNNWHRDRVEAFVSTSMSGVPADWSECDDSAQFSELDVARSRLNRRELDLHVIRCTHEWIPPLERALSEVERDDSSEFWRRCLSIVLERPRRFADKRDRIYPYEDEVWVLAALARAVPQMRSTEAPFEIVQTVLDLPGEADEWPKVFAESLHRAALSEDKPPAGYASIVRSMIHHVLPNGEKPLRWYYFNTLWDLLLGVDGSIVDLWSERHDGLIHELRDVVEHWMANVPVDARRVANFANWLARPPTAAFRVQWLPCNRPTEDGVTPGGDRVTTVA